MNRLKRINPSAPILAILLLLAAIPRLINLTGSPTRLDDEGTYVAQAYAVSEWVSLPTTPTGTTIHRPDGCSWPCGIWLPATASVAARSSQVDI